MIEDRYEIRSKIGQGGVGAVYRAFDRHLNREIAIKRVLADGGYENQEEATEAMLKEATALCSVQHPHIVTVFDAGVDKDGPYVVMELLSGRTIDEMIERGTLTFEDFREVAVQSQEALIAAQALDLVHRDIKPTNLMVTWLPSGRFQLKLVDFGLAKFSPKPSLQTISHGDAVFGSIHFMAPEQFERIPLDKRTDMYSMGCVYYYALSGRYPFGGETAPQVMNAHLQHEVIPISELRPDLPAWVSDWVMWHIARPMEDRPGDARESLKKFLMSENNPTDGTPEVPSDPSQAAPAPESGTPLVNPQGVTGPVNTTTAPQPIQPPAGQAPSIHTAAQQVQATPAAPQATGRPKLLIPGQAPAPAAPAPLAPPPEAAAPEPAAPTLVQRAAPAPIAPAANPLIIPVTPAPAAPAPVPVAPPAAAPPVQSVVPAPQITVPLIGTPAVPHQPVAPAAPANPLLVARAAPLAAAPPAQPTAAPVFPLGAPPQPAQHPAGVGNVGGVGVGSLSPSGQGKSMSNAVKGMIAAALVAGLIVAGVIYAGKSAKNDQIKRLNEITAVFKDKDNPPEEIDLSGDDVQMLLDSLSTLGAKEKGERATYLQALNIGKATDGTDISEKVASYAKDISMDSGLLIKLFQLVGARGDESALSSLIEYASKTDESGPGQAALNATKKMASTSNFESLLSIITTSSNSSIKNSAVGILSDVVRKSENPSAFSKGIVGTYKNTSDEDSKVALLRLMGSAGGDEAASLVKVSLAGDNPKMKVAAVYALRNWPDDSQFDTLFEYTSEEEDDRLRGEGFTALIEFLKDGPKMDEDDLAIYWSDIAGIATGDTEQRFIIDSMVSQNGAWADDILDYFIEDGDSEKVQARAEDAKDKHAERMTRAKRSGASSDAEDAPEEEKTSDEDE